MAIILILIGALLAAGAALLITLGLTIVSNS
jgi:hypothetical protein